MCRRRIDTAQGIGGADREFLLGLCDELGTSLPELTFALPPGVIHGDAHAGNLLADQGRAVLSDFESAAWGPREWDLLPSAIAVDRYGASEAEYRAFSAGYGFDVREWPGYPALRRARELTMTTWIGQNAADGAPAAREFARRVASLREGDFSRAWQRF